MKNRGVAIALIMAGAVLAGVLPAAGQTTTSQPNEWTVPRTPDGQPDLQGVWDFRTLTPLERPRELAGKEVFTAEEAAEFIEASLAEIEGRDDEVPVDIVGNYNQFWFDRGTTVVGTRRTSRIVETVRWTTATPDAGGGAAHHIARGTAGCPGKPWHRPPDFMGGPGAGGPVHPARQSRPAYQPWWLQQ